jgi:uncharacterized NAD-dependent epimerase/dehydratase family protein
MAAGGADRDQLGLLEQVPDLSDVAERAQCRLAVVRMPRRRSQRVLVPSVEAFPRAP